MTAALDELRGLPGVEAASIARMVPLNDNNVRMADVRTDMDDRAVQTTYTVNSVGPEYFKTMGIPILQGREFLSSDRAGSPAVLILNENFARRSFGTTNPVGHTVWFGDGKPTLVVGVAKNSKYFTLGEENRLALYLPYLQGGSVVNLHFLVRTSQSPESAVREVSAALGKLDRTAAIETKPMRNALGLAVLPSQVGAALLGAMGVLGLTLAACWRTRSRGVPGKSECAWRLAQLLATS